MTFSHQVAVEVSLQVVVEAEVELLAAEGLIAREPGRGTRVIITLPTA